jgi:hypothetical protein
MRLGKQRNQCQGCKQYFNSNTAFDWHRTGKYGVNRRCMTAEEMLAKGMSLNEAGFWITQVYDPTIKRSKHEDVEGSED